MAPQIVPDIKTQEGFLEQIQKSGGKPIQVQLYYLNGIFGELAECNGVAEEVIRTEEQFKKYGLDWTKGGTYVKILGCSYLYKGDPQQQRVFGFEQAKSNISSLPRHIIGPSFFYSAAVLLRAVLQ